MGYQKRYALFFSLLWVVSSGLAFAEDDAVRSNGSDWGDLGYSHAKSVDALPVEPVHAPSAYSEPAPAPATAPLAGSTVEQAPSAASNISTLQNTYGVMTEENKPAQLYVSPFGGVTSFIGNSLVNSTPGPSFGASLGVLISSQLMIQATYVYSQQSLSNPVNGSVLIPATGVFDHKENEFDLGARLFFLGREARFRPFFGAGMGYARSTINYSNEALAGFGASVDYISNNMTGFGEVGAEFAFTRSIVANAMFKFDGVISTNNSGDDPIASQGMDSNKLAVGNSLSRTSAYSVGAGLGIYF